jgi:hypothetical protein
MRNKVIGITIIASMLAGCANTVRGGPQPVYLVNSPSEKYKFINDEIDKYCLKLDNTTIEKEHRNNVVLGYMLQADRRYNQFESALLNENRTGNFSANALSLALTTAGTLAGESAAQTLSAIDTGLKGATQSYGKEFLFDQTIPALLNQMRASRAEARERIYAGIRTTPADWPLCLAMQELANYEQAGTLTGAITNLTSAAANDKMVSEENAERELTAGFRSTELGEVISRYADKSLPPAELTRRLNLLVAATQQANLGKSPGDFFVLQASGKPEDLQKLINEAQKLEKDPVALRVLVLPTEK